MRHSTFASSAGILFVIATLLPWRTALCAPETVTIAGASVTGIYYQAAETLCDLLKRTKRGEYQCFARTGSGSVFNVNALKQRLITFGIVQSDRNQQAWEGRANWRGTPVTSVRSVVALYDEALHLVAHADSGIRALKDLKGARVNLGNFSSGQRANARRVLTLAGIDARDDIESFGYQQGNAFARFASRELDAFFYTVGVPSDSVSKLFVEVPSALIPLDGPKIRAFVDASPVYVMTTIPAGTYAGMKTDVATLGVRATLMTTATTPDKTVYSLLEALFDNFEAFKRGHPAYGALQPETMLKGLTAELHPGAARFFADRGWINPPAAPASK